MKKIVFYSLFLFAFSQCKKDEKSLNKILQKNYEQHFISSGNNFPEISLYDNDRYKLLVGLHNGFKRNEIQKKLKWSDKELQIEIDLLKKNGYLTEKKGSLFPSISIIMDNEGEELFKQTLKVAEEIAQSIIKIEDRIEKKYSEMEVSSESHYSSFKFFLFSNVLLDNWQINNVEKDFLNKKRTLRHGKRYYIQLAEKGSLVKKEVFGIYGNQYMCQKSACFITYGNNRVNNKKTFEELSSMDIPLLSKKDQSVLAEMAEIYKPKLIDILKKNKSQFIEYYNNSVFKNELSFEEYFVWYYHFLYTKATNILSELKQIKIPETGIFRVKLEK